MFAWIATRTGVQLPSPPAFALMHEKRRLSRRSFSVGGLSRWNILLSCLKDYGLAGQPFFPHNVAVTRLHERLLLRLHTRE